MKATIYIFLFLLSGCAFAQDIQQFEKACEYRVARDLPRWDKTYFDSFKARKHILRIDTVVLPGTVRHAMTNTMADMPGAIELYKLHFDNTIRYLLVEELAQPLGGYLGFYLLNTEWETISTFPLYAKYSEPSYSFYLSPEDDILISARSEFARSVYPQNGLSIIKVETNSLSLAFRAQTYFFDVFDTMPERCRDSSIAKLCTKGRVIDSITVKRVSLCRSEQNEPKYPGTYAWNTVNQEYTRAFDDFSFDTLLSIPQIEIPILFDLDSHTIRDAHKPMLDSLAQFLLRTPGVSIQIRVHLDTRWSDMYSRMPDQRRAESICNYLIRSGVSKVQVSAMGMADHDPLISEAEIAKMKTQEEVEMAENRNRRVEIRVLKR